MGRALFLPKWYHLHKLIFLLTLTLAQSLFDSDKSSLLEFKSSLSDPFGVLSSWQGSNYCSWYGLICDSSFRVSGLNLSGAGYSGSFCPKFARFPIFGGGLRRVCYKNGLKLSGSISPNLAKLTKLRVFSLPFNEISGELPDEIMGMENLEVLDLEGNSISGYLPDFRGLSRLRVLNLGFNKFVGEIPGSLSNCTSLQVLNLAGNRINGTIPEFIGSFGDLRGIYLSYNLLGGTIPREIVDNCGKLEYLELSGNFMLDKISKRGKTCVLPEWSSDHLRVKIPSNSLWLLTSYFRRMCSPCYKLRNGMSHDRNGHRV